MQPIPQHIVTTTPKPAQRTKSPSETVEEIARRILDLDTLETRKSDRLDFREQAVWVIKEALEAAFQVGVEAGRSAPSLPKD